MTLAEKLLSLRTERGMSQEDLAEKLDVSRQSVSKWETGQSVPDLDKIIKLANLFGVSVDELVREGERLQPPEPQVVYVERGPKPGLTATQKLGIVFEAVGGMMDVFGIVAAPGLIFPGAMLVILGLPLILAKRHPILIDGWLLWAVLYLFLCTPVFAGVLYSPFVGINLLLDALIHPEVHTPARMLPFYLALAALTLLLIVFTVRLCVRAWKNRKNPEKDG